MTDGPTTAIEVLNAKPRRGNGPPKGSKPRSRMEILKARMEAEKQMVRRRAPKQNHFRKVSSIGQQIALVPGGIREFMKWVKGAGMRDKRYMPVFEAFDALLPSRQNAVELESICVTLGVPPFDLLGDAVKIAAEHQRDAAKLIASLAMPKVMRVNVKQAQKPKSVEDRRMFMQATGILPTPSGSIFNISAQANSNVTNKGEPSGLPDFEDSVISFSEVIRDAVDVVPELPEPSEEPIQDGE